MAMSGPISELDHFQGTSFLASQAALAVMQRKQMPEVREGRFEVLREGPQEFVVFTDPRSRRGVRVGGEAEMSADEVRKLSAPSDRVASIDAFQGVSYLATRSAAEVFRRQYKDLDLAKYKIELIRDGDAVVVIFADKTTLPGTRGSLGEPGFEVALDPKDGRVLRSQFVR
jgi:hypothetical protein